MEKGLGGHVRNTPSHLSLISAGDFKSRPLEVDISHASVMFRREVFSELIGKVFSALLPLEAELILLDVTPHPVELHVKCFGAFTAHVDGEDAMGGFAVIFDCRGRLRMSHFNQGCADGNSLLAVEEDCTGFSLGGRCHDSVDGLALGEDQDVWSGIRSGGRRGRSVAHVVMSCITTTCFGMNKIRCVTVNVETHVASMKTDDGVWLGGSVVHQHLCIFYGVGGGRSLLRADFIERDKHGGINGA